MSRFLLGLTAAAVSCGRIGFGADGRALGDGATGDTAAPPIDTPAADAAPACTSFGPWSAPIVVGAAMSAQTDWGPALSADGLELVFASNRTGDFRIYDTTRGGSDQPWGSAALVAEVPGTAQDPALSADRLELYWGTSAGVQHATRASLGGTWQGQTTVIPDSGSYTGAGGPDISADGLTLMFTATADADGLWHEWISTRATTADAFGTGSLAPGVTTPLGDSFGTIGDHRLEIVYSNEDTTGMFTTDLYTAARGSATAAFGSASLVAALNTNANEGDANLSDDGTTMVFASDRGSADWDVYQSTRSCQ